MHEDVNKKLTSKAISGAMGFLELLFSQNFLIEWPLTIMAWIIGPDSVATLMRAWLVDLEFLQVPLLFWEKGDFK
jgi:hypothetical protein